MLRYNYYIDFYDKMKSRIFIFFIFFLMTVQGIYAQDLLPRQAVGDHADRNIPDSISVGYILGGIDNNPDDSLTIDNLYKVLDEYNVKFKKIVVAQALLETGNFSSDLCRLHHNIFGLRHPSDGSYYEFSNWKDCVKAYRNDVQYKYMDGDYYVFLKHIGYAEDRHYTSKVKVIADRLPGDS